MKGGHETMASIAVDPATPPVLGQPLNFIWSAEGLHGNQNPRIEVSAYQDVDGDGAVDDIVFTDAINADPEKGAGLHLPFDPFGGVSSTWLARGGPAHCTAKLYYWDNHGQQVVLAGPIEFDAAG